MSDRTLGPPMDPSNPLLRVELLLAHGEDGFCVINNSNVPMGIDWELAFDIFVSQDQVRVLPPGEYVFTVRHKEGFRVAELPTDGLSKQTRQDLIDHFQPFCEEMFRVLCVGIVSFPTPREIRLVASGIVNASAQTAIRSLKDPDKLEPDFLTLVPMGIDRFSSSRMIKQDRIVALLTQEGGVSFPGGMVAMLGVPNESGHLEVMVGYLPGNPISDWLNVALVERLALAVEVVRAQILFEVIAQFDARRSWYEKASDRLKELVDL